MSVSGNRPKELIILTEHFAPSTGATAQLITDLAEDLHRMGAHLRVLTSTPGSDNNYSYPVLRFSRSGGSAVGVLQKLVNGLFFLFGSAVWLLVNIRKNQSLLIVSNPPFIGLIGVILSVVKGTRFVYLFQDVFPRSASLTGILPAKGPLVSFWRALLKAVLKRSQSTVVLSTAMIRRCHLDFGSDVRLSSIPNWAVLSPQSKSKMDSSFTTAWKIENKFTVQYSGNFGRLHEILTLLEAARLLQHYPIAFVFVGGGAKLAHIRQYCDTYELSNVLIKPYQDRSLLADSLAACDISVVSLIAGAQDTVAPSKLYGILASSRPIILIANKSSDYANLIKHAKCGIVVEQGDVYTLSQMILSLREDNELVSQMSRNSRRLYDKLYGRSKSVASYYQLFAHHEMI